MAVTCAGCGVDVREEQQQTTDRGVMHRRCAGIWRIQARKGDVCFKHAVPLDETTWCPRCREESGG